VIILTGGAGFIGSVLLGRLNSDGFSDIMIVDELESSEKWKNLVGKQYQDYIHKDAFPEFLTETLKKEDVEAVIHLGACTSTTERNVEYLMRNNFLYSKTLAVWCFEQNIPFIYASSASTYGNGKLGFSDEDDMTPKFRPLNAYGYSKHIFDLWLLRNGYDKLCTGFKFFNVFGPNEYHKGAMASLVYKAYHQVKETGGLKLFSSYHPDYKDGEFLRDFIYVKDAVDVLMWTIDDPSTRGIYNLGTGKARSWNDLASALFMAMGKEKNITYIDMPEEIRPAYQYFTQANMLKLRKAGYKAAFTEIEDSVTDYVKNYLSQPIPYC
jgi:ADP-L-glycero-D-manno-heptose 6-epimerase